MLKDLVIDGREVAVGKGTHRAVARYERFRDRFRYVLRCDVGFLANQEKAVLRLERTS